MRISRLPGVATLWLLALATAATAAPTDESSEWPVWRGPNQDLTLEGAHLGPPGRPLRLEVAWKKELGSGYSAISVSKGVAVTGFSDEESNYFGAFAAETGEELWRVRTNPVHPGRFGSWSGPISTPLIEGERVFVFDTWGRLIALELKTGRELWARDLTRDLGAERPFYGFASSPVPYGDSILLQSGGTEGAVTRFDAATGRILWTAGGVEVGYQTPSLVELDGRRLLLVVGLKKLAGLDPDSGEVLFEDEHQGNGAPTGTETANLVSTAPDRMLVKAHKHSTLFRIRSASRGFGMEEIWQTPDLKNTYVVSVHHDGLLIGYSSRILSCVDAETGERLWRSRSPGDGFPIVIGGQLVVMTKKGTLSVAPASREGYDEVASLHVFDDLVWTPASYAGGSLYVRSLKEWARIDVVESGEAARSDEAPVGVVPGSAFQGWLEGVRQAPLPERAALVDAFLSEQDAFPVVEGEELVHFVYRGPEADVGLVADLFGGRTDRPMHRVEGTDLFYFSTPLEHDARIEYSFLGEFQNPISDPLNPREPVGEGPSRELTMPGWVHPAHLDEPPPERRGRIETLTLRSDVRDREVELQVYLPRGYDPGRRYPVAYVLDGKESLENSMVHTLDNVIGRTVEPVIAVFVPYLGRWMPYTEYVGEKLEEYVRVLLEEIVPAVDREYPTVATAEGRALIGRFNTTYTSVYVAFRHPGRFGNLGLQTMRWEPGYRPRNRAMLLDAPRQELTVYLDWSTYDARSELEGNDFRAFSTAFGEDLRAAGYDFVGGEAHDGVGWPSWRNRTDKLLEALFPLGEKPGWLSKEERRRHRGDE